MLDFRKMDLADSNRMKELLSVNEFRAAEYSVANAYNWSEAYNIEIAFAGNFLLMRAGIDTKHYLFPVGSGDLKTVVQQLIDNAQALGQPFIMRAVLPESKQLLEQLFPGQFEYASHRDVFDYIYSAEDLINLTGKKFQPKRNHISRFKKTFSWSYEDITETNLPECVAMNDEWCRLYSCGENQSLKLETCAAYRALRNFAAEQLLGGLLRVEGKVVAYTVGERLTSDTLIVHIEKAFGEEYQGVYQVINQEFVKRHAVGLRYVNREDDAGDEGLRKAKLSYQPAFLLEKYVATADYR